MRSCSGIILGLMLLGAMGAADSARAQDAAKPDATKDAAKPDATKDAAQGAPQNPAADAAPSCEVPAYLLASDSPLPKVAAAVKDAHVLNIQIGRAHV